ncbi:MAG: hypothetical protein IJ277_07595 [Bacteroidaceae bacterium]|nr:hypothetical protein [Bacteroidaceae bacterium]
MQKEEAIKKTRTIYRAQAIVSVVLAALLQTGLIDSTGITMAPTTLYAIEVAGIMLTICLIPLAIKGFSARVSKAAKRKTPHFIEYYHNKCNARTSILFMVIMMNIALYYILGRSSGPLYCGLLGVAAAIYSYPAKSTFENYLNNRENEE